MFWLYNLPYYFFSGFLGPLGGALACFVMTMGILRCSFLLVLTLTGDWARLKAEWTEGYEIVMEKISNVRDFFLRRAA
jgi:hypothetical protein